MYDYSEYFSLDELQDIRQLDINLGVSLRKEYDAVNEKPSVLLGVVLGAYRKNVNNICDQLKEEDLVTK